MTIDRVLIARARHLAWKYRYRLPSVLIYSPGTVAMAALLADVPRILVTPELCMAVEYSFHPEAYKNPDAWF